MAVYVDPLLAWPSSKRWPYGWVSHLFGDTPSELHAFAQRIGLKRHWCSDVTQPNSPVLHYDLSPGKREEALLHGAISVSHRDIINEKTKARELFPAPAPAERQTEVPEDGIPGLDDI